MGPRASTPDKPTVDIMGTAPPYQTYGKYNGGQGASPPINIKNTVSSDPSLDIALKRNTSWYSLLNLK